MTEADWDAASNPVTMPDALRGRASARKLRLFACGLCRAVWADLTPHSSRRAVEVAERFADGLATDHELNRARSMAAAAAQKSVRHGSLHRFGHAGQVRESHQFLAADSALAEVSLIHFLTRLVVTARDGTDQVLKEAVSTLLRCVFQNPTLTMEFDPSWRTEAAVALARGAYEERAFDRLPLLADALEDAGCGDAAVLSHLRGGGAHVRGCWVVDGVLGRE